MNAIKNLSINQSAKESSINSTQHKFIKQHPEWDEVYRLFANGTAIVYHPVRDKIIKLRYSAKELLSISQKQPKTSVYGFSPFSGQKRLLLINVYPKQQLSKPAKNQTKVQLQKHLIKYKKPIYNASSHKVLGYKTVLAQDIKSDSPSALVVAIKPDVIAQSVSQNAKDLDTTLDSDTIFSTIAIADDKREIFATTNEKISLAENETAKLTQPDNQLLLPGLNLYISAITSPSTAQIIAANLLARFCLLLLPF